MLLNIDSITNTKTNISTKMVTGSPESSQEKWLPHDIPEAQEYVCFVATSKVKCSVIFVCCAGCCETQVGTNSCFGGISEDCQAPRYPPMNNQDRQHLCMTQSQDIEIFVSAVHHQLLLILPVVVLLRKRQSGENAEGHCKKGQPRIPRANLAFRMDWTNMKIQQECRHTLE